MSEYQPKGLRFYDKASNRNMILVDEPDRHFDGWICYQHPDGNWVTLRKATDADREALAHAPLLIDMQNRPQQPPALRETCRWTLKQHVKESHGGDGYIYTTCKCDVRYASQVLEAENCPNCGLRIELAKNNRVAYGIPSIDRLPTGEPVEYDDDYPLTGTCTRCSGPMSETDVDNHILTCMSCGEKKQQQRATCGWKYVGFIPPWETSCGVVYEAKLWADCPNCGLPIELAKEGE